MATNKISSFSHKYLLKDYKILKLIFTILGFYLIAEEFCTFFVRKPTYTSYEKRDISGEDFPEIMLCPEPSFDLNALKSIGFKGPANYFEGRLPANTRWINFAGNKSENIQNIKKTRNLISTLKSRDDCPYAYKGLFKNNTLSQSLWHKADIHFQLIPALYPYHQCCKVRISKVSQGFPLISLQFYIKASTPNINSFKVFMADQMTASYFDQYKKTR